MDLFVEEQSLLAHYHWLWLWPIRWEHNVRRMSCMALSSLCVCVFPCVCVDMCLGRWWRKHRYKTLFFLQHGWNSVLFWFVFCLTIYYMVWIWREILCSLGTLPKAQKVSWWHQERFFFSFLKDQMKIKVCGSCLCTAQYTKQSHSYLTNMSAFCRFCPVQMQDIVHPSCGGE